MADLITRTIKKYVTLSLPVLFLLIDLQLPLQNKF